jgi:hypothetical protein
MCLNCQFTPSGQQRAPSSGICFLQISYAATRRLLTALLQLIRNLFRSSARLSGHPQNSGMTHYFFLRSLLKTRIDTSERQAIMERTLPSKWIFISADSSTNRSVLFPHHRTVLSSYPFVPSATNTAAHVAVSPAQKFDEPRSRRPILASAVCEVP